MGESDLKKLEIYLKSGHTICIECESYKFEYCNLTGEYCSYQFDGLKNPYRISMVPSQISAYIVK